MAAAAISPVEAAEAFLVTTLVDSEAGEAAVRFKRFSINSLLSGRDGASGGNKEARPGDWMCDCGNNNFSFRRECNSCKAPKPAGAGEGNSGGGRVSFGDRQHGGDRHRPY
jgi:hypothetical protein